MKANFVMSGFKDMFCGKTYLVMSQAEMMISYFVTCLM